MKFSIDVHDTEVSQLLTSLIQITGIEPWSRRFEWLHREFAENPFMEEWLRERCSIEWTFNEVLCSQPLTPQSPFRVENMAQYELVAFAAGVVRIYERLSAVGKHRLRGMLLDGIKEDKGLLSIQHEVSTAVHLMCRGFDVEFHDLEQGGGFDFVARKDSVEIEIECKMFSADLGRKIHRRRMAVLFRELASTLAQIYRSASTGLIVRIIIPDRLTPSPEQHQEIDQALRFGILGGKAVTRTESIEVQVSNFSIESSSFSKSPQQLSQREIQDFVSGYTGRSNSNLMIQFSPGQRAVVLSLESRKSDEVLNGMHRQLREAAKGQFTKTRPAILAVQLHDLTVEQFADLAQSDSPWRGNATGLQLMTSDFLQSPSRAHIHSVAYRSHGLLTDNQAEGQKRVEGLSYQIGNGYHPLYKDPKYSVFGI
ncbi:MAG: hypothetical protein Q7J42_17740 [Sulfuritalea sp.]|nr:hypothetical protein [Sulfuritalea sp.]